MTPVYEVRTKHTKEVLKDFITFRENVRNVHVTFRLVMLAVCSVTLTYIGRDIPGLFYTFLVLTILFGGFAIIRKPLALSKLAKADSLYQNGSELHFIFGESEFRVENGDVGDVQRFKYGEVEFMYADHKYFYINVNNEDQYMLPKTDFTLGEPEKYYDFMMHKTGKIFQPVKLSWKMKGGILKQALKDVREENKK